MTSPATHGQLQQLLQDHYYFGLSASQVHLFECTVAPPAFAGEPLKAITLGAATLTRGAPGDSWCSVTGWRLTPLQLFMMYSCDIIIPAAKHLMQYSAASLHISWLCCPAQYIMVVLIRAGARPGQQCRVLYLCFNICALIYILNFKLRYLCMGLSWSICSQVKAWQSVTDSIMIRLICAGTSCR